jgi:hypothetical protein
MEKESKVTEVAHAMKIYLITHHRGRARSLKSNFVNRLTTRRSRDAYLGPTDFKWEGGATRGARLAGAVLFDPAPGRALVRAYHEQKNGPLGLFIRMSYFDHKK